VLSSVAWPDRSCRGDDLRVRGDFRHLTRGRTLACARGLHAVSFIGGGRGHPGQRRGYSRVLGLRSEEHTSELQSRSDLVCRLLPWSPRPHTLSLHDALPIWSYPRWHGPIAVAAVTTYVFAAIFGILLAGVRWPVLGAFTQSHSSVVGAVILGSAAAILAYLA